ncbi:MAG: hypothetical protein ACHQF2_01550 [Flavobacteriales bacterium]
MSTLTKTGFVATETKTKTPETKVATSSTFWEDAEYNRYGITPLILLIVVCMGGIAAATAGNTVIELLAISYTTVFSLTTIIAVSPMKVIISVCSIALFVDLLLIIL